ncbi:dihydroorotase [Nesterenkonia alkaliphila]|uniref:Dihydroorotase n=1 Tax=Nesterenkonia alkaliphila TaxID=1463631 RepID=A0A7K1UM03_9MICC|nr:dihydroorotase [Nesterenkonia alkaliphila]MVT27081.1 dihydroorotase [Nesterenkonia alkaliphila]GFZ88954.1 dihydroorotase [Nesterenkonia alkaliphila]
MSTPAYLITGARPYGEEPQDILITEGRIAQLGPDAGRAPGSENAVTVQAQGQILLPGMVDLHTHLREPGREDAETVETGSRAAAKGGFTAVHAMANSSPVADTAGVVEQVHRLGLDSGWTEVYPVGAITKGLAGKTLAELGAMAESAAQVRMFSDDGHCVNNAQLMRRALEYVKTIDGFIAQHAQDADLTAWDTEQPAQMNEGRVSATLGLPGWPAVAEEAVIARDVLLADYVGARLHICHVSTAGSVEILRWAKARGIQVTAEVTPHHLMLTDELVATYNPVYKVNPPLRTEADTQALREALAEGIIDAVGTDHAPHPDQAKECEWAQAAMGMTGLETALNAVQHAMVETGLISWRRFVEITSERPAEIYGHPHQGRPLAAGEPANLILVDPSASTTITPEQHATKGRNSPFRGLELPGRVTHTFLGGHQVLAQGELTTSRSGRSAE